MELKIKNKAHLSKWMDERRQLGRDMRAIKGPAPAGATYDDGEKITMPVNVGWKDCTSGQVVDIEYETE